VPTRLTARTRPSIPSSSVAFTSQLDAGKACFPSSRWAGENALTDERRSGRPRSCSAAAWISIVRIRTLVRCQGRRRRAEKAERALLRGPFSVERTGIETGDLACKNRPPVWLSERVCSPEASLAFAAATSFAAGSPPRSLPISARPRGDAGLSARQRRTRSASFAGRQSLLPRSTSTWAHHSIS
jgi:hypothetical protein